MKLITPPKLMPPCQSAAASGTFPTEQTKLIIAMKGPTITFWSDVQKPWPVAKTLCQTLTGTRTVRKPAMRYPAAISFRTIFRSANE
jgi:hypothetical protein